MKKKLSLEEQCLTIEQAKELQKLGVDFSNANLAFVNVIEPLKSIIKSEITKYYTELKDDLIPTLTNSEMLEMLPDKIVSNYVVYNSEYYRLRGFWYVEYEGAEMIDYITFKKNLLRDALFEMLKYLKTIKLM